MSGRRVLVVDCAGPEMTAEFLELGLPSIGASEVELLTALDPELDCTIALAADCAAALPERRELGDFDGVLWTGTPFSAFEPIPEVQRQVDLMREVFAAGVRSLGSVAGCRSA